MLGPVNDVQPIAAVVYCVNGAYIGPSYRYGPSKVSPIFE
jgi:hypothetical protein